MPVPTLVTDLSTTVASNSPSGSDNVFPDLDNYLRALSGFVASIRDNSGNGWVSPYLPLTYSAGTANGVVYLNGSKVVTTGSGLVFDGTNFSTTGTASATKLIPTGGSATGNGMYLPAANTLGFSTNGAQAMTLTSNGDLLLGTTTYSRRLTVGVPNAATLGANDDGVSVLNASARITLTLTGSTYSYLGIPADSGLVYSVSRLALAADSSTPITFHTSSSERARITSGGDLLVGTTDAAATATTNGLICDGTNPGFVISRRSTGAAQTHLEFRNGGANVGNISSSTTTTTYATTSDRRLKDNIVPAPSASNVIDAIQIVSHDWKSAPDEHVTYGVIAQDLALVAPQAVLQGDDGDEIEKTWGVDYSKLVPVLIKEIQSLRARVAALEQA